MASPTSGARRALARAAERAVRRVSEDLLDASNADLPVGEPAEDPTPEIALRERGDVDVDVRPGAVIGTVSYNTAYARRQHEDLELEHPRGGGPKFLERNLLGGGARLAAEIERELRR